MAFAGEIVSYFKGPEHTRDDPIGTPQESFENLLVRVQCSAVLIAACQVPALIVYLYPVILCATLFFTWLLCCFR